MTTRAVALLSGGLDSMLAIRILQEQGVEVEAINGRRFSDRRHPNKFTST